MKALETLLPVFVMLGLGMISNRKRLITPEQKEGAKTVIFQILFPFLIFHALFTAQLKKEYALVILYVFAIFCLAYGVGCVLTRWHGKEFARVTPFMLLTCEGGNVALPLYITIVGTEYMTNTVMLDMASAIIAFMVLPILVTKKTSGNGSIWELLKAMFSNSFVIAMICGLGGNLMGIHGMLESTAFYPVYTAVFSMITSPIMGIILFVIGYDLKVEMKTVPVLAKLMLTRVLFYGCVIAGFFLLFSGMMTNREFKIAVLLYFMCPTGFAVPVIISPLCRSKEEESFESAYLSLYMIITLIVYTSLVVFV